MNRLHCKHESLILLQRKQIQYVGENPELSWLLFIDMSFMSYNLSVPYLLIGRMEIVLNIASSWRMIKCS